MSTALPPAVNTLIDAANANDKARFLETFTADGVVDDWGREFVGHQAIAGWSDGEFLGVHVSLAVTGVAHNGEETVITADVGGQGFNGRSHFTFRTDGSLVTRMTIRA